MAESIQSPILRIMDSSLLLIGTSYNDPKWCPRELYQRGLDTFRYVVQDQDDVFIKMSWFHIQNPVHIPYDMKLKRNHICPHIHANHPFSWTPRFLRGFHKPIGIVGFEWFHLSPCHRFQLRMLGEDDRRLNWDD